MKKIIKVFLICCIFMICATIVHAETEIIVDNSNTSNGFSYTSGWKIKYNDSAYGGTARVVNASATNAEKAKWTPEISVAGYYRIYITYPAIQGPASTVNVQIAYGDGNVYNAKNINQSKNTSCWVYVGTFYLPEGNSSYVALKPNSSGNVAADAVKFVLSQEAAENDNAVISDVPSAIQYNSNETVIVEDITSGEFYLSVNGEPFYIKGMCKSEGMSKFKEAGGNTIRTYSSMIAKNTTKKILDEAQADGMKVMLGLAIPKESEVFNYQDNYEDFINGQDFINLKKQIDEFKDHPALLMWAVGNEIDELKNSETSPYAYKIMNAVAEYIKTVDPYHPVTSVHAGSSPKKIMGIKQYAPCVDIVSTNAYKGITSVHKNIVEDANWNGAYMITEYAFDQPSEVLKYNESDKVVFDDVVIEPTDKEKADKYYERYNQYIYANKSKCLGSFAFASYNTYRGTHTWYDILLEDDFKTTRTYDAMYKAWNGKERDNTAPYINGITINNETAIDEVILNNNSKVRINVSAVDEDSDTLTYKFEVRKNSMDTITEPINGITFLQQENNNWEVTGLPSEEGVYRLFAYVYDNNGNIGYGNIPFKISNETVFYEIAKEEFNSVSLLGEAYTKPLENGFDMTWKNDRSLSSDSVMKIEEHGGYRVAVATPNATTQNIFNVLTNPIDMDTNSVYYGSWVQGYTATENNKYLKVGFTNTENAQEIATVFSVSDMARIGIKTGNEINYSDSLVNSGSLYNILMKIKARTSGNDIISVKVWPINSTEPYNWTYEYEKDITGKFPVISFQTNSANGSRAYFGAFAMEQYVGNGEKIVEMQFEQAYNYINGEGLEPVVDLNTVTGKAISEILKLKDNVYINEIALLDGNTRVSFIPETTDGLSAEITVKNDTDADFYGDSTVYVACYDKNAQLQEVDVIELKDYLFTGTDYKKFTVDITTKPTVIKVFVWENMQSNSSATTMRNDAIINY